MAWRKKYLEAYTANEIKEGREKQIEFTRKVAGTKSLKDDFEYLCKKQLCDRFGEPKGLGTIEACLDKIKRDVPPGPGGNWHRPDRDNDNDDDDHREYKIFTDTGGKAEADNTDTLMTGTTVLETAQQVEAALKK